MWMELTPSTLGACDGGVIGSQHGNCCGKPAAVAPVSPDAPGRCADEASCMTRLVVLGSGVAAIEAVLALDALAEERVQVTVLSSTGTLRLAARLPERALWAEDAPTYDVRRLGRLPEVSVVRDSARSVDVDGHVVTGTSGQQYPWDLLLVATGATVKPILPEALVLGADPPALVRSLVAEAQRGLVDSIALVVAPGAAWTLPVYELALHVAPAVGGASSVEILTPEPAPLALFGAAASAAVASRLDAAGVELKPRSYCQLVDGELVVRPGARIEPVDALVELAAPAPVPIDGLPAQAGGFLEVRDFGQVVGAPDVYAVGDAIAFPIKHGGLAAQQADAAAEHIALRAGADVVPSPFRPILRGELVTPQGVLFLETPIHGGAGEGRVSEEPLWAPATKVHGRYLSEWLATVNPRATRARTANPPRPLPRGPASRRAALGLAPYDPLRS
jgi:sulfide:quinone oxidoreductase